MLAVDLSDAIKNGVIPATGEVAVYNDIDNSQGIAGRVSDLFEAVDMQKSILSRAAKAKAAKAAPAAAPSHTVNPTGASE